MNGLRVVVSSRIYAPEPSAASLRLAALTDALLRRGADVTVLTTRTPAGVEATQADRSSAARILRWPVLRDRSGYVRGYMQYLSFDVPLFLRILFGASADVHVCEPPPTSGLSVALAASLRRRPFVYYAADIWSDAAVATDAPGFVVAAVRWMESFVMRRAAAVLVVSEGVQARVHDMAPTTPTAVVGHGVDLELFAPDGDRIDSPADIVYVGSASEWHGAEIALRALARVMAEQPRLTAAFIGQGSSWDRLQEMTREFGLADRIRFHSTVPPERAAAWLRSARLSLATLVPGKGYDFAVPTKLYASVSVGTPVAYAGPDPVRSMIESNALGIGTEYDTDAYADGIRDALAGGGPDSPQKLIAWARENLSSAAVGDRAAAMIEQTGRSSRER